MSNENPSYPPRCVPSRFPSRNTVASQSTAPKCRSSRCPIHSAGILIARSYQRRWFSASGFITPDSGASTGNGTRISPACSLGGWSIGRSVTWYFHSPLRFIHFSRTIIGRGYSAHTHSGETSFAHRVWRFPLTGFHPPSLGWVAPAARLVPPTPTAAHASAMRFALATDTAADLMNSRREEVSIAGLPASNSLPPEKRERRGRCYPSHLSCKCASGGRCFAALATWKFGSVPIRDESLGIGRWWSRRPEVTK